MPQNDGEMESAPFRGRLDGVCFTHSFCRKCTAQGLGVTSALGGVPDVIIDGTPLHRGQEFNWRFGRMQPIPVHWLIFPLIDDGPYQGKHSRRELFCTVGLS